MSKKRRHYTPEKKVIILKKNLLENVPVSDVCDEYNIHPTLFYRWQKEFFEKGSMVFEKEKKGHVSRLEKKIAALEDRLSQKNEVLAELMEEYVSLKKNFGEIYKDMWVAHDIRDNVVDFVNYWSKKTEIKISNFIRWIGIGTSKFYDWKKRYGKVNEHNSWIPRDFWLEEWEKEAIIKYFLEHPNEGYRRLTFMMIDEDVVAVSPSSVYRVLSKEGYLRRWNNKSSRKGKGFKNAKGPHEHWHIDISYLNIRGTFYYLCSILDGYSRYIVHWEIREKMREADVEIILQRAKEKFPDNSPRIISDNGPQFIAKDFKEFIRVMGMSHVRTSPYYPQSNGKIERWHQSLKKECIRVHCPISLSDARRIVGDFVEYYNSKRLHSALGYITPKDKLEGKDKEIFEERDRKLYEARERRKVMRQKRKKLCLR